jgi:hypothetical protein
MSISLKVEVIGLRELEQVLRQLPAELVSKGQVGRALLKGAEPVLKTAQSLVPVSKKGSISGSEGNRKRFPKGRLKRAIKKQKHPNPRWLNEIVGVGVDPGTDRDDERGAWYGYIVEFRTSFLRRALEINRREATRIISLFMGGVVERAGKKAGNENARKVGAKLRSANKARLLGPGF